MVCKKIKPTVVSQYNYANLLHTKLGRYGEAEEHYATFFYDRI